MSPVKDDLDLDLKVTGLFLVTQCSSNISGRNSDTAFIFISLVHLVKVFNVPCQRWPWPNFQGHRAIFSKTLWVLYFMHKGPVINYGVGGPRLCRNRGYSISRPPPYSMTPKFRDPLYRWTKISRPPPSGPREVPQSRCTCINILYIVKVYVQPLA